eukprot:273808_1
MHAGDDDDFLAYRYLIFSFFKKTSILAQVMQTASMEPVSGSSINQLNVDPEEIDTILDELEENEKKQFNQNQNENDIEWQDILDAIRSNNANFIKNLISSKQIAVNSQNPSTGKTVLIYAVIIGNMDLVRTVCNFGG